MKGFIKVTGFESGNAILININDIIIVCHPEEEIERSLFTEIYVEHGHDVMCSETVEEVEKLIETSQV